MTKPARLVQLYPPTPEGRTLAQRVHQEWERRQAVEQSVEAARRSARLIGELRLVDVVRTIRGGVS